jgi:hypothetical protein
MIHKCTILVAALLLCIGASDTATAAKLPPQGWSAALAVKARHHYSVEVTVEDPVATLSVSRGFSVTNYLGQGRLTGSRLRATFGGYGTLSMNFRARGEYKYTAPIAGCMGKAAKVQPGLFVGHMTFIGEHHFSVVRRHSVRGVLRFAQWDCSSLRKREENHKPKLRSGVEGIMAYTSGQERVFAALGRGAGGSFSSFVVEVKDQRKGILIERRAIAIGRPDAFILNRDEGVASVRPPKPFFGRATYGLNQGDPCEGTLGVALPGAPRVGLCNPAIKAQKVKGGNVGRILRLLEPF